MSRFKKTASALAVLFGLELLSLGLFANGTFSWSKQYAPPLLKEASHTNASGVKIGSPAKTDDGFVLKSYGEPAPRSGILTAKESPRISVRSFVVSPFFVRITLAPKVSRYIFKSVLNL